MFFLVFFALLGLALKYADYENRSSKVFDYSAQDGLFNAYSQKPDANKSEAAQKKVANGKETSDFSKNKSNLNIKFANRQNSVNVNIASAEELEKLPGIGPKTAGAIVSYRKKHGRFERKEDLLEVKGIGKKKFEKIKDLIEIN